MNLLLACLLPSLVAAQEVNLHNANLHLGETDFRVQKPGVALEMERNYNSRSNESNLFGYGWSTPFDVTVRVHADGSIMVVDEDGFVLRFTPGGRPWAEIREGFVDRLVAARRADDRAHGDARDEAFYRDLRQRLLDVPEEREAATWRYPGAWVEPADGEYRSHDRGTEILVKRDLTFQRQLNDGTIQVFDDRGRLVEHRDTAGQGVRLDYDRDGRLFKVAHTDGGGFTLIYGGGRISEMRDTEGRAVSYGYDERGDLVQVKGPGKRVVAYAYDDEHNLEAVRGADGGGVQVRYDKERDWVVAVKRGEAVTRYGWEVLDEHGLRTACSVTHPDGSTTRHEFDASAHVALETGPQGTTRTVFSACCQKPLEVTTPDGRTTRYDYDDQARLTGISTPDGLRVRYHYHPDLNRIVQATYSDGRRYEYTYDAGGRVVLVQAAEGATLDLIYGGNGKVEVIQSSDGGRYTFDYDADGRPVRIVGRRGVALDLEYGLAGDLTASRISTPSSATRQAFYRDLERVLDMLEPAAGSL